MTKSADLTSINAPEDEKIRAMMSQSTQDYDPSRYVKMKGMSGPIPINYTCYRCGRAGHWIKNCPTNAADVKRSTGIPRSFMVTVEGPEVPGALLTSTGQYAVPMIDHEAYKEGKKERPPFAKELTPEKETIPQIPEELLCMICRDLLSDAVLIPCCGNSYCDECVRQALLDSDEHECPTCHEKDISPDTLIPNRFLRTAVMNFKNETGYTKVVRKMQVPVPVPVEETAIVLPQADSTSSPAVELAEPVELVEPVEPIEPVEAATEEERIPSPVSLQEEDSKMSTASPNTCDNNDRPDTPVRDEKTSDGLLGDELACDSSLGNGEENSTDEPVSFAISTITTRGACPISAVPMSSSPQLIVTGPPLPMPLMSSIARMKLLPGIDSMGRPSPYSEDGSVSRRPPNREVSSITGLPLRLPPPIQRPDAASSTYSAPISTALLGAHPSNRPTYTVPSPLSKSMTAPPPLLALPTAQMLSRPPPQHFPQNLRQPPPSLYAHHSVPSSMFRGPPPPLHHTQQQPLLRRPPMPAPMPPPPGSVTSMQPLPPGIRPMHPPPPQPPHHSLTHHPPPPSAHLMPPVSDPYHLHPPPMAGMPPHYQPRTDPYYRDHAVYPPSEHADPYALHHHQLYDYSGVGGGSVIRRDERRSRRRSRTRSRSRSSSSSSKSYSRSASSRSRSRSRSSRSHSSRSRSRSYSHSGRSRSYSPSLSRSRTRSPYPYHRRSRTRSTSRPTTVIHRSRSRSKVRHAARHVSPPPASSSSTAYHRQRSRSRSPRRSSPPPLPLSVSSAARRHHREYTPEPYYGGGRGGGRGGSYHRGIRGSASAHHHHHHHPSRPGGIPTIPSASSSAYDVVHRDGRNSYHDAYHHLYDGSSYDYEVAAAAAAAASDAARYDPRGYDVERYEEYYRAAQSRHRRIWTPPPPPPMVTPLMQHVDDSRARKTTNTSSRDFDGRKPLGKKSLSPMNDRRDYRRDEPSSRSERNKDNDHQGRSRDTRDDREFDARRSNKDDDPRRSGRGDDGVYDSSRRNRGDERSGRDDSKRSMEVSKNSSVSASASSKQKDPKKSTSSSTSSSLKHEQKMMSEKETRIKESTKTSLASLDSQQQQQAQQATKEKRAHKRKGHHGSAEDSGGAAKKTKSAKKSAPPSEVEISSSEIESTPVGTGTSTKKTSKKKKAKTTPITTVMTAAVAQTTFAPTPPKFSTPIEVTTALTTTAKSPKSMTFNLIDVSMLEANNAKVLQSIGLVETTTRDQMVAHLQERQEEEAETVEAEEEQREKASVDRLDDESLLPQDVHAGLPVQNVKPEMESSKKPKNTTVMDENVLTAPAPEISKWELYDADAVSQGEEDDDEHDFHSHHHHHHEKPTSDEKKPPGLSADIVQRAEKAILHKVMKPATSDLTTTSTANSKSSRKTTTTMTTTTSGSDHNKEEVVKEDAINTPGEEKEEDNDAKQQIFEPTSFKGRDKSGSISIRLDRSKFAEQVHDEGRPSSSSSSIGRNNNSETVKKITDESNKSKGGENFIDEDVNRSSKNPDAHSNRPAKKTSDDGHATRHVSKVSRRSRSSEGAANHRSSSSYGRHESKERAHDSRHVSASGRRSPSKRSRERDRVSIGRDDRHSRRLTTKERRSSDKERTSRTKDDADTRGRHRPVETFSSSTSSSHRNLVKKSSEVPSSSKKTSMSSTRVDSKDRNSGSKDGVEVRKERTKSTGDRRHLSIDESKFEPNYDEDVAGDQVSKESSSEKNKSQAEVVVDVKTVSKDSKLEGSTKLTAAKVVETSKKQTHRPSTESSDNSDDDSKSDAGDDEKSSVGSKKTAKKNKSSSLSSSRKRSASSASDDDESTSAPDKQQHQAKKHKKSNKHKKHKKHKHKKSKKARRNSKKESAGESEGGAAKQSTKSSK